MTGEKIEAQAGIEPRATSYAYQLRYRDADGSTILDHNSVPLSTYSNIFHTPPTSMPTFKPQRNVMIVL